MVKYDEADSAVLDNVFAALANPARRATLDALGRSASSVSDLATHRSPDRRAGPSAAAARS